MKIALPSDNQSLSTAEFSHCCALIDYYVEEGRQIIPYCEKRGRDAALYDRGNVWQQGFVDFLTNMLISKLYNNVNRLRLIGFQFASYRLFDLSWVTEAPASEWFRIFYSRGLTELPENVDTLITDAINPQLRIASLFPDMGDLVDRIDNKYLHSQPLRFGEIAGEYRGFMFNGELMRYWKIIAVLARTKIFEQIENIIAEKNICRIMEIGAGYGGLGFQLKKTYGDKLQFIAVDLVESLIFSSCYLSTVLKENILYYTNETLISDDYGIILVPSFRSPEFFLAINNIDLCINTVSMNEMSAAQVEYYAEKISKTLSPAGIFYECNCTPETGGTGRINVKSLISPYFMNRITIYNSEVMGDGMLDLWSNAFLISIENACKEIYGTGVIIHYTRPTIITFLSIVIYIKTVSKQILKKVVYCLITD